RRKLAEIHDFPLPDSLVDRQVEKRLETLRRQAESKGLNPRQLDWGRMRAAQREGAVEELKSTLILREVADKNNLQVGRPEIEAEIRKIAAATRQTPEV